MRCVLYSMKHGKIEINNAKAAKIFGTDYAETMIYSDHVPIIGEITGGFEILHYTDPTDVYEVNLGFFEYSNGLLTIVANFKDNDK